MTDLRQSERHTLLCRESEPVLRMVLTPDMSGIWVATSDSSIRHWPLNNRYLDEKYSFETSRQFNYKPVQALSLFYFSGCFSHVTTGTTRITNLWFPNLIRSYEEELPSEVTAFKMIKDI